MSDFPSEDFRTVPKDSEEFGNIPKDSEPFRNVQNVSERRSDHTLTVREVARMFEAAGVPRTERSITNWCQANKTGIARLDAFFDPNERRYFISPQSMEIAIQEEQSKERAKGAIVAPAANTQAKAVPNASAATHSDSTSETERLRHEIRDLQITNRAKDMYIERFELEREKYEKERTRYVEKLMTFNRRIGHLETRLGIDAPMRRPDVIGEGSEFPAASEEGNSGGMFSES